MPILFLGTFCLSLMNDAGLGVAYDRAPKSEARSRALVAMAKRGGPVFVASLERKLVPIERDGSSAEVLTALRRAQRKPDPLVVELGISDETEAIFPNLPRIEAEIVNRDAEKATVQYRQGGDYRSGRQERWRFGVRDARGKAMAVRAHYGNGEGGGLSVTIDLKPGESWGTALDMRRFISLPPGDYTVEVEHHADDSIAGLATTKDLLVWRSRPFKLHVQPRVIDVTKADRAAVREGVAALPAKGPVKVLVGSYHSDTHGFIAPDSAAGRLLTLGWRAVPELLETVRDAKTTDQQRAWAFAILYGITSLNDPRHERGVLADYQSRGGSWAVFGGRNGRRDSGGMGFDGEGSSSGGRISAAAQLQFAKQWEAVREHLVVRERP